MDLLVEFCRTGRLGPIDLQLTAAVVERLLGRPSTNRELHGEPNWQLYRYGSLFLTFRGNYRETLDLESLQVTGIKVHLADHPLELPPSLAAGLTEDWTGPTLDGTLRRLQQAGVSASLIDEDRADQIGILRTFAVDGSGVHLLADDDLVTDLERVEQ